jgi:hypothetical protein
MSLFKVIKKILKLMAHEKSARGYGNENEANLYADRIADLRQKHGITQELILEEQERPPAQEREPVFNVGSRRFKRKRIFWQEELLGGICYFTGCEAFFDGNSNLKWVRGEKAARKRAIELYLANHDLLELKADAFISRVNGHGIPYPIKTIRMAQESFLLGYVVSIQRDYLEMRRIDHRITELEEHLSGLGGFTEDVSETPAEQQRKQDDVTADSGTDTASIPQTALIKSEKIFVQPEPPVIRFAPSPQPKVKQIQIDSAGFENGKQAGAQHQFDPTDLAEYNAKHQREQSLLKQIEEKKKEIKSAWQTMIFNL